LGISFVIFDLKGRVKTMRFHARPVLSALLLIAVVNVSVFASGAGISSSESASSKVLLGKLVTTSNRPIMVNGAEAITGAIILSGAQLDTSAVNIATVQLPNVATVTILPSSVVSLSFDAKSVTVKVTSGDATLVTAEGVTGKVLDAAGNPRTANPTAPTPAISHPEYLGIAGIAIGSAALIWAIIAHNRANDARDSAAAANAAAASLAAQLAALRTCLAGQTTSPIKLCTSF
jgi:hypothetical protein